MADVIVTGLPRSGSATVAALIDSLSDAVCLNTPPWQLPVALKQLDILPYCKWLTGDFVWTRRLLLDGEPVSDFRAPDGSPLLDGLSDPRRKLTASGTEADKVVFARPGLSGDFILAMRQNTLFTSVLPTLIKFRHFSIIAVIRHPIDTVMAWKRLGQPAIDDATLTAIVRFWPEAVLLMQGTGNENDRFAQLYDAFIQRYHESAEHVHIMKYEDVIDDPETISRLFAQIGNPSAARFIQKRPAIRNAAAIADVRQSFRKYGVFTRLYYPDF